MIFKNKEWKNDLSFWNKIDWLPEARGFTMDPPLARENVVEAELTSCNYMLCKITQIWSAKNREINP